MCKKTMTDIECYQKFLDSIFGENEILLDSSNATNNIISTFKYSNDYKKFKDSFSQRLINLKKIYENSDYYDELKNKVKLIVDKNNWEGAYAELAAFDVLNSTGYSELIQMEYKGEPEETYAHSYGKQATNLDGYFSDYDTYFDVKILSDALGIFLKNIVKEVIKETELQGQCNILPEYNLDDDVNLYQTHRKELVKELTSMLKKDIECFNSEILPGLSYRIQKGAGVNFREGVYNPYHNAMMMKDTLIKRYVYKFMKNKPFFLIMVNFPWYNQLQTNAFDFNKIFYRALARRTFIGYKNDSTLMKSLDSKFSGNESVFEVTKKLTGIIFIDDSSITEKANNCYVYTNPNADNKSVCLDSFLNELWNNSKDGEFDDFKYDNY
jgi:hypothetical protein